MHPTGNVKFPPPTVTNAASEWKPEAHITTLSQQTMAGTLWMAFNFPAVPKRDNKNAIVRTQPWVW